MERLADDHPDDLGLVTWARWQITGERTSDTAAILARFATTPPYGPASLGQLADLGPAAADHEGTVRTLLAGGWYQEKIAAAYALWRITGNTSDTAPVLLRFLGEPDYGSTQSLCVEYLAGFGAAAAPAVDYVTAFLGSEQRTRYALLPHDAISWDEHCQQTAMAALTRIRQDAGA